MALLSMGGETNYLIKRRCDNNLIHKVEKFQISYIIELIL